MPIATLLPMLVQVAGVGQLVLILASLAIPRVLGWREEIAKLRPLMRQLFWTYAAYIWTTNLCFGLLSAVRPRWLLDQSPLAVVITAFMALYWGARLLIQFAYFDRSEAKAGLHFRLAEAALVSLFIYLTLVYGTATVLNMGKVGP